MNTTQNWENILQEAITKSGTLSEHYRIFHNYSFGNTMAAFFQAQKNEKEFGPINTFVGWQKLGRQVKKGEKAIQLCMPISCKKESKTGDEEHFTFFAWKNKWFFMSQTEGEEYCPEVKADKWDQNISLENLQITLRKFDKANGNIEGYAGKDYVALNPLTKNPASVLFHEIAHIVLGHTKNETMMDGIDLAHSEREVEAESVSYLICSTLGFESDLKQSRGYLQTYLKNQKINEKSAQRIFSATDKILKSGYKTK